ncbi:MAG TPA: hypothetical protein VFV83_09400 [Chthoniobacteraceae bacterium]|nr:hypothetical protein [Chthoniobacteraceae bacterium]
MNSAPRIYQRLPGGRMASLGTRASLWLGPDHLLALERTIGSERYRRFYLRDIEAIIIRRTSRRAAFNYALFVLIVISALPATQFGSESRGALVSSGVVVALWLLLALVNTLRGASCDTRIRTAVQIEPLPSLGRLPAVEKTLARIRPLIEQTQGTLAHEALLAANLNDASSMAGHMGARHGEPSMTAKPVPRHVHAALFSVLIVSGIVSLVEGRSPSAISSAVDLLLSFVALILLVFALRLQAGSNIRRATKRVTWAVVAFFMVGIAVGFFYGIVYAVRHQGREPVDPLFFRSEPSFVMVQLTAGSVALLLGVAGLIFLFKKECALVATTPEPLSAKGDEP